MTRARILAAMKNATSRIVPVVLAACVATACRGPRIHGDRVAPGLTRASEPAPTGPTRVAEPAWWVRTASLDADLRLLRTAAEGGGSGGGGAADLAKKLQNPLAAIKAATKDSDVFFDTGNNATSVQFQIQPVYAVARGASRSSIGASSRFSGQRR